MKKNYQFYAEIGRKGGQNGKGSLAKRNSASNAAKARWSKWRMEYHAKHGTWPVKFERGIIRREILSRCAKHVDEPRSLLLIYAKHAGGSSFSLTSK